MGGKKKEEESNNILNFLFSTYGETQRLYFYKEVDLGLKTSLDVAYCNAGSHIVVDGWPGLSYPKPHPTAALLPHIAS